MKKKNTSTIAPEVQDIINASVDKAVKESITAINNRNAEEIDCFKSTERLLYSYPKLKELIDDEIGYVSMPVSNRSKDIVKMPSPSGRSPEEAYDVYVRGRELSYQRTKSDVEWIERALEKVKHREEYKVLELKYFKGYTFEEISAELEIDESTARRRRSRIVNDLAVYLFGSIAVNI